MSYIAVYHGIQLELDKLTILDPDACVKVSEIRLVLDLFYDTVTEHRAKLDALEKQIKMLEKPTA